MASDLEIQTEYGAVNEDEPFLLTVSYSGFPYGKSDIFCRVRSQCIINDIIIKSSLGKTYDIDEQFPITLEIDYIKGVQYFSAPWDHLFINRQFDFSPKEGETITVTLDLAITSSGLESQYRILSYKFLPKVKDSLYYYKFELQPDEVLINKNNIFGL